MEKRLQWGILGGGRIAATFARGLQSSRTGSLAAIGARDAARAAEFAAKWQAPFHFGSYQELLDCPEVEAVYIATPHPMHAEWAVKAAEAGKHILCEKPLTMNLAEAEAVVEAARRHDVFLMEAFMYRCHPRMKKLQEIISGGELGEVRLIKATFSFFCSDDDPEGRLLNPRLGGGAILDIGCYCASIARLAAGAALGLDVAEPLELRAFGRIGEKSRVDEYSIANLKFPGDILAQLSTGIRLLQDNSVTILGTDGSLTIPAPWWQAPAGDDAVHFLLKRRGEDTPREIRLDAAGDAYALEADVVADNIERRQAPSPAPTWDDTLGNMRTLDLWRREIGMLYEQD